MAERLDLWPPDQVWNGNQLRPRFLRSQILLRQGKITAERGLWRKALRAAPKGKGPLERAHRFRIRVALGDYAGAVKEAEGLLDEKPSLKALRMLTHPWEPSHLELVMPAHAEALDRLVAMAPNGPWGYFYRGYVGRDRDRKVSDYLRIADFAGPRYGWMLSRAAWGLLNACRYEDAIK